MNSKYHLDFFFISLLKQNVFTERTVLWYMTFWGFAINYMVRMNINIAIVSMVKHSIKSVNITVVKQCSIDNSSLKSSLIPEQKFLSNIEDVNIIS